MSFKKIAMTLALILSTVAAVAQTKTVKGVIYEEETGEPMPGATVSVEGSTRGVMTDLDGSFELTGVKPTDKLKFECLGNSGSAGRYYDQLRRETQKRGKRT